MLSYVNTKLRDNYASLDALCDDLDVNRREIEAHLATVGYVYDARLNKFV